MNVSKSMDYTVFKRKHDVFSNDLDKLTGVPTCERTCFTSSVALRDIHNLASVASNSTNYPHLHYRRQLTKRKVEEAE